MKLIGSLTEQTFRNQLIRSWESVKKDDKVLYKAIENFFGEIASAYVLGCTPEQFEDLYTILVNGESVIYVEILREGEEVVRFEVNSVAEYEKELRYRRMRIQLAVALDLAGR